MNYEPRDYQSEDDGFQLIAPDLAIFLLICGGFVCYVFRDFL